MSELEIKFLTFRVYRFSDTKAFRRLHTLLSTRVRRYIAFRVNRSEDADELTSEVFLRAWEYMTTHKVENLIALLFKMARNMIADHYRKSGRTVPLTPAAEANLMDPGSIVQDAQLQEEYAELLAVMKGLKSEYQDVLRMRYLEEMSTEEIAEALDKTANATRVLLHRAKSALKKKM